MVGVPMVFFNNQIVSTRVSTTATIIFRDYLINWLTDRFPPSEICRVRVISREKKNNIIKKM